MRSGKGTCAVEALPVSAPDLVGASRQMESVREQIGTAAQYDEPVLIVGESGTGKELVARAIHAASRRGDRGFHAINCGAIPEELLVSELFGHCSGAFTGASRFRLGRIRAADRSSLFLDEVSETTGRFQVALLRVIDNGEVQPLGQEKTPGLVDVRFIAATNRSLADLMSGRGFRSDLFYRLAGFLIQVPPLRERCEDIAELAELFVAELRAKYGRAWTLTGGAAAILESYDFPGNVRELRQIVFSSCAAAGEGAVSGRHVHASIASRSVEMNEAGLCSEELALAALIRGRICSAILAAEGNLSGAARCLEVPRSTLQHLIARHGIDLSLLREKVAAADAAAAPIA